VTTVFTLVDAVVLRPLPVSAPGELVWLRNPSFSYPMFEQVRDRARMLRGVFAWEQRMLHTAWTSEPEPTSMLLVSGAFHETLGLRPAAGRLLNAADVGNTSADAQAVAVLSYAAWQRRYGGDPAAIGRTLRIEGQPFTIVGVTPPGFFGVAVGMSPDVTIPVTMLPRLRSDERDSLANADRFWLNIMGRLRSGVSIAVADAAFQTEWAQALVATTAPHWQPEWRARYLTFTSGLEPGAGGYSPVRRQFQAALWLLFGLVALVLVVACATVANLLLAAAAGRRRELALRLAIGAGRARLVQQLFLEGVLLAGAGGALGCLFSTWVADLLVRLLSTRYDPVTLAPSVDLRVLAFTTGAIGIAALAFTIAPIVRAVRIDPGPVLKAGVRQAGADRRPAAHRASAGCRTGRLVGGPAGGLGALRAQPVGTPDQRCGLRPRSSPRGQRRCALAHQRAVGSPRSRSGSHGLVRRAVAAPAGDAWRALGEPVGEAAHQQRIGIVVGHLQRRGTTINGHGRRTYSMARN
jgi:putative ABC transport system permease protein